MESEALVNGRFRKESVLGRGITGTAYLATDVSNGLAVVLKEPRQEIKARNELKQEARALRQFAAMAHAEPLVALVPKLIDAPEGPMGVVNYFAIEFLGESHIPGNDFERRRQRSFTAVELLRIWRDVLAVLSVAHRAGFMHSDLERKTDHVWIAARRVEPEGGASPPAAVRTKLIDWGMAGWPGDVGYNSPRTYVSDLEGSARLVYELWTGSPVGISVASAPAAGRPQDQDAWSLLSAACQTTNPPRWTAADQMLADVQRLLDAREAHIVRLLDAADQSLASDDCVRLIREALTLDPENPRARRLATEREIVVELRSAWVRLEAAYAAIRRLEPTAARDALAAREIAGRVRTAALQMPNPTLRVRQVTGNADSNIRAILLDSAEFDVVELAVAGIAAQRRGAPALGRFVDALRKHTHAGRRDALALAVLGEAVSDGPETPGDSLLSRDEASREALIDALARASGGVRLPSFVRACSDAAAASVKAARGVQLPDAQKRELVSVAMARAVAVSNAYDAMSGGAMQLHAAAVGDVSPLASRYEQVGPALESLGSVITNAESLRDARHQCAEALAAISRATAAFDVGDAGAARRALREIVVADPDVASELRRGPFVWVDSLSQIAVQVALLGSGTYEDRARRVDSVRSQAGALTQNVWAARALPWLHTYARGLTPIPATWDLRARSALWASEQVLRESLGHGVAVPSSDGDRYIRGALESIAHAEAELDRVKGPESDSVRGALRAALEQATVDEVARVPGSAGLVVGAILLRLAPVLGRAALPRSIADLDALRVAMLATNGWRSLVEARDAEYGSVSNDALAAMREASNWGQGLLAPFEEISTIADRWVSGTASPTEVSELLNRVSPGDTLQPRAAIAELADRVWHGASRTGAQGFRDFTARLALAAGEAANDIRQWQTDLRAAHDQDDPKLNARVVEDAQERLLNLRSSLETRVGVLDVGLGGSRWLAMEEEMVRLEGGGSGRAPDPALRVVSKLLVEIRDRHEAQVSGARSWALGIPWSIPAGMVVFALIGFGYIWWQADWDLGVLTDARRVPMLGNQVELWVPVALFWSAAALSAALFLFGARSRAPIVAAQISRSEASSWLSDLKLSAWVFAGGIFVMGFTLVSAVAVADPPGDAFVPRFDPTATATISATASAASATTPAGGRVATSTIAGVASGSFAGDISKAPATPDVCTAAWVMVTDRDHQPKTVSDLARACNMAPAALVTQNSGGGLTEKSTLRVGQKVFIPARTPTPTPTPMPSPTPVPNRECNEGTPMVVGPGDNPAKLYSRRVATSTFPVQTEWWKKTIDNSKHLTLNLDGTNLPAGGYICVP